MSEPVIRILNRSGNPLPAYATEGASGMDLRADLPAEIELQPLQRVLIPTGLFLEIPAGFEAQVRPRSGLALHQGITVLNTPGTIDADYRGELKVILVNFSAAPQLVRQGDRIAQLVFQRIERVCLEPVAEMGNTARDAGGFGHTGLR